jgi:hypothetical protein
MAFAKLNVFRQQLSTADLIMNARSDIFAALMIPFHSRPAEKFNKFILF